MKGLKVYLASRFTDQDLLRGYAHEIFEMGHLVTSRWLHERPKPWYVSDPEFRKKTAYVDWQDLSQADLLIRFIHDISKTGGADTEFGIALEQGKLIWLVGPPRNIFHELADQTFGSWPEAREALVRLTEAGGTNEEV